MTQKGKRPQEAENQDPQGVLKDVQTGRFNTTREDIAEIPAMSIQPCHLIPDYRDPTESILPIVVHTPKAIYCLDGWNLIEQARTASLSNVRCHVYQIQENSDIEIALRKVAIRTKPVGGTCCYAELVRNASLVANILMNEMENPVVFSHGGSRRGACFTDNREDDLREVLSERLGKDRSTINSYLNYGRFLTHETMEMLVAQDTGRAFFEKAQVNKRRWIGYLESDGLDEESITNQISLKMPEWHREYQETGKIKPDFRGIDQTGGTESTAETEGEGDQGTDPPNANPSTDENSSDSDHVDTFAHPSPPAAGEAPVLPKIEDVTPLIQTAVERLSTIFDQSPVNYDQTIETIDEQILQLATAKQMLADIRDRSAKEAA
jgi:hypothetical protein